METFNSGSPRILVACEIKESPEELLFLISQHEDFYINRMLRALYLIKTDQLDSYSQLAEAIGLSNGRRGYRTITNWLGIYKNGGLSQLFSNSKCKDIHSSQGRGKIPYWLMEKLAWELRIRNTFPEFAELKTWVESILGYQVNSHKLTMIISSDIKPRWRSYRFFATPNHDPLHLALRASVYEKFEQWRSDNNLSVVEAINKVFEAYFKLENNPAQPDLVISSDPPVDFYIQGVPPALNIQNLAKRLGVSASTVSSNRGDRRFFKWSSLKDPDGIGWQWNLKKRTFEPVFPDSEKHPIT